MSESSAVLMIIEDGPPGALSLVGELDMAEVPDLRARLARLDGDIEVNCSGVSFIDSTGLYLFVEMHRGCDARGVKFSIVDPSQSVSRMFEITGLDALLHVRRDGSAR